MRSYNQPCVGGSYFVPDDPETVPMTQEQQTRQQRREEKAFAEAQAAEARAEARNAARMAQGAERGWECTACGAEQSSFGVCSSCGMPDSFMVVADSGSEFCGD